MLKHCDNSKYVYTKVLEKSLLELVLLEPKTIDGTNFDVTITKRIHTNMVERLKLAYLAKLTWAAS